MKTGLTRHFQLIFPAVLAGVCAWALVAKADWGSVRANNRDARRHEPEQAHREAERVIERRHLDIEGERRHAFFWWGFHPGMAVAALPAGSVEVSVGPIGYYYYGGVYYQPNTAGSYSVVAPPLGVIVPQLPDGAEAVVVGATTYYYAAGAFYLQQPNGFAVVTPPSGATVAALPPGAAPVTINGVVYYLSVTTYLRPLMQGGVTVYVVAHP